MTVEHCGPLWSVGSDERIWRLTLTQIHSPEDMRAYVDTALREQKEGKALPFVVIEKSSGTVVGSTRYGNIDMTHRRVEIGWTWYNPQWQRTAVNTETKFLLLTHAFERLGCIRVELKTDALNQQSRRAILRIGAKEEGILRQHNVTPSGRLRDTVYFSIIDSEWPEVKKSLVQKLRRRNNLPDRNIM